MINNGATPSNEPVRSLKNPRIRTTRFKIKYSKEGTTHFVETNEYGIARSIINITNCGGVVTGVCTYE